MNIYRHIPRRLRRLAEIIDCNIPVICFRCKRLVLKKRAAVRYNRSHGWVWLCQECEGELYEPFGEEEQ